MNKIVALLIMVSLCGIGPLFAQDDIRTLAVEYLELSKAKETVEATVNSYVEQTVKDNPKANKAKVQGMYNRIMGWDALKEPILELVMKTFTQEELQGINAFYGTPPGLWWYLNGEKG
jgi:hypothetical protein